MIKERQSTQWEEKEATEVLLGAGKAVNARIIWAIQVIFVRRGWAGDPLDPPILDFVNHLPIIC